MKISKFKKELNNSVEVCDVYDKVKTISDNKEFILEPKKSFNIRRLSLVLSSLSIVIIGFVLLTIFMPNNSDLNNKQSANNNDPEYRITEEKNLEPIKNITGEDIVDPSYKGEEPGEPLNPDTSTPSLDNELTIDKYNEIISSLQIKNTSIFTLKNVSEIKNQVENNIINETNIEAKANEFYASKCCYAETIEILTLIDEYVDLVDYFNNLDK